MCMRYQTPGRRLAGRSTGSESRCVLALNSLWLTAADGSPCAELGTTCWLSPNGAPCEQVLTIPSECAHAPDAAPSNGSALPSPSPCQGALLISHIRRAWSRMSSDTTRTTGLYVPHGSAISIERPYHGASRKRVERTLTLELTLNRNSADRSAVRGFSAWRRGGARSWNALSVEVTQTCRIVQMS